MKVNTTMRGAFIKAANKAHQNGEAEELVDKVFTEVKRGTGTHRIRKGWRVLRGSAAPKDIEE